MDQYWHKQTADQPLSTDLLWSRPENKRLAGKLLIIGGSAHGFRAPAEAYAQALSGGAGVVRVILPDALRDTVQSFFPQADFAPSTPSGSLARDSLDILLEGAGWADTVLIAGDLNRNSETTIAMESFISKYSGPLIVAQDGVDHFSSSPKLLLDRKETVLVGSLAQLQKIATKVSFPRAFTLNMDLLNLVSTLHDFSNIYPAGLIVKHLDNFAITFNGMVGTMAQRSEHAAWHVPLAARSSVWWMQNKTKLFAALNCALYEYLTD